MAYLSKSDWQVRASSPGHVQDVVAGQAIQTSRVVWHGGVGPQLAAELAAEVAAELVGQGLVDLASQPQAGHVLWVQGHLAAKAGGCRQSCDVRL